jgi:hypothetical protein
MNIAEIKAFLFKTYIYGAIALTLLFLVLKCFFNITYFDKFLYLSKDEGNQTEKLLYFIGFHVVFYFVLGLIFQYKDLWLQIIQTIFVEFALVAGEKCSVEDLNYQSAILSIVIGMSSYIAGGFLMKMIKKYRKRA